MPPFWRLMYYQKRTMYSFTSMKCCDHNTLVSYQHLGVKVYRKYRHNLLQLKQEQENINEFRVC